MAQPTTLADLRAAALDYADLTGSDFPDPTRLDKYINVGLSKLHNLLVNSYQDYYRKTQTLTLVAGQEEYDLPANFLKSMEMFYESAGRRYSIPRFNRGEVDGYRPGSLTGGTVTHWYTPQKVTLREPTDRVDITVPVDWEDYVALEAAVRLLIREESNASDLATLRNEARQEIIDMAEPRDEGDQGSVDDVYGRFGSTRVFREGRYLRYRIMGRKIHFMEFEHEGA